MNPLGRFAAAAAAVATLVFCALLPYELGASDAPTSQKALMPQPPAINAAAYVVIELATGQVLAEKQSAMPRDPASLTKLMTAYVVFEALYQKELLLTQAVAIPAKHWPKDNAQLSLEKPIDTRAEDLIRAMLIRSANDAAYALSVAVAGSEEAFIVRMNRVGKRLGLANTAFRNVTGLTETGHLSTAQDIATLSAALLKDFPQYAKFFAEKSMSLGGKTYENRNRLLFSDPTVDGLKTGFTDAADWCLATTVSRAPRKLLVVLLAAQNDAARFEETQKLIDWAFSAFQAKEVAHADKPMKQVNIWKADEITLPIGLRENAIGLFSKDFPSDKKGNIELVEPLLAPIRAGEKVGTLRVANVGGYVYERDVVALASTTPAPWWKQWWHSVLLLFKGWLK